MRPLHVVFPLVLLLMSASLAAAGPGLPETDAKCVWIVNGPTLFSRACVAPNDADCPAYTERWTWEGGYSRTCVGLS